MTNYIISVLISALGFFIGAQLLSGVKIKNYVYAVIIAVAIGVLNIFLGTFLKIITLGFLSFGIFALFLDAILILVADWFLEEFEVKNLWWALGLAFIVSITEGVGSFFF